MGQRHKHADVIIAWAEGKDIQYRDKPNLAWRSLEVPAPRFYNDWEYRIKPPTKKYRVALINGAATTTADTEADEAFWPSTEGFVRWLTDWTEYEE